jgi:hypothetical protein
MMSFQNMERGVLVTQRVPGGRQRFPLVTFEPARGPQTA